MTFVHRLLNLYATGHTDIMNILQFQICGSSHSDIHCKVRILWYMQNVSLWPRHFLEKTFSVPLDIHHGWSPYHSKSGSPLILIYNTRSSYSNTCRYLTFACCFAKDEQLDCIQLTTDDISVICLVTGVLYFLIWCSSIVQMQVPIMSYIKWPNQHYTRRTM